LPAGAAQAPEVVLLAASEETIDLLLTFPAPELEQTERGWRMQVPGVSGQVADAQWYWPAIHLPVALPPDGTYSVLSSVTEGAPLPIGRRDLSPAEELARELAENPAYGHAQAAGHQSADALGFVRHVPAGFSANLRVLGLEILPVRSDTRGDLHVAREIRIRIDLDRPEGKGTARPWPLSAQATQRRHERTVINPEQVRGWMKPADRDLLKRSEGFHTATSSWLRIEVDERGLYRLTADDLRAAGIEPTTVPLEQLRLFAGEFGALTEDLPVEQLPDWMTPCGVLIEGGGQTWSESTEIYFLGQGPDGWRDDLGMASAPDDPFYKHPYSDHHTYWLCWGGEFSGTPARIDTLDASAAGDSFVSTGLSRLHLEKETIHESRAREAGYEWERFFWAQLSAANPPRPSTVDLSLTDLVAGSEVDLSAGMWGANWRVDARSDHYAAMMIGSDTLSTAAWAKVRRAVLSGSVAVDQEDVGVTLVVPPRFKTIMEEGVPRDVLLEDRVYLAWVEAEYWRELNLNGGVLDAMIPADSLSAGAVSVSGLDAQSDALFFETSDPFVPTILIPRLDDDGQGGQLARLSFELGGTDARLFCVDESAILSPVSISVRSWDATNEPFRQMTAPIDYLIVCPENMLSEAERLAEHRQGYFWGADGTEMQSGRTLVVDIADVFDQFAWGQYDITALRNLVDFIYTNWTEEEAPVLSHLLLLGNAHFDPRNHLGTNLGPTVPSYEFYVSTYATSRAVEPAFFGDSWFGLLDGPNDRDMEVALGRIPARSVDEAAGIIDKVINYDLDAPVGAWRSRIVLTADDVCQGYEEDGLGAQHTEQSEELSAESLPPDVRQEKIYLYDYGPECQYPRKPAATQDLTALLEDGVLLFNFVGHGSEIQIADERLLELPTMTGLQNAGKPFLMITASCAVGKLAHGGDGLALAGVRHTGGGALAAVSAGTVAFSVENKRLNDLLLKHFFSSETITEAPALGPGYLQAKTAYSPSQIDNEFRYNLLGDPGSRLALPRQQIELTLADVPQVSADADTLMRGGTARLSGQVVGDDEQPLTDFDGTAVVEVLDSGTLAVAVDHTGRRAPYERAGACIYRGEIPVEAGAFETTFFVPTALITGERADARIHVYASQDEGGDPIDAVGVRRDLLIPDDPELIVPVADTLAPTIEIVWEDPGTLPAAGSRVMASLSDSSGIYISGLDPSRSVVVSMRDEYDRVLVADDLAASLVFGDDYRSASLTYALPEGLPAGEPLRLRLEASDNVGQRGQAEVSFTAAGQSGGVRRLLEEVYNLPNPTEQATRFLVSLSEVADVEITIYTVTGRKIATLEAQGLSPERGRTEGLPWAGFDEDGDPLANGVYFYRVVARTGSGEADELIERLAVYR